MYLFWKVLISEINLNKHVLLKNPLITEMKNKILSNLICLSRKNLNSYKRLWNNTLITQRDARKNSFSFLFSIYWHILYPLKLLPMQSYVDVQGEI